MPNADAKSYSDAECHAHRDAECYANRDTDAYTPPSHAQAAAYTASSADSVIVIGMR